MTQYEMRELQRAAAEISRIENQPLEHKREAKKEFQEALRTEPGLIVERMSWYLDGNYGFGHYLKSKEWLSRSKNFNINARLMQSVAALEWQCPARQANQAYNSLTETQKDLFNLMVNRIIENHRKDLAS